MVSKDASMVDFQTQMETDGFSKQVILTTEITIKRKQYDLIGERLSLDSDSDISDTDNVCVNDAPVPTAEFPESNSDPRSSSTSVRHTLLKPNHKVVESDSSSTDC
jgi:hypothetical protein